jgi:hypothetical protein
MLKIIKTPLLIKRGGVLFSVGFGIIFKVIVLTAFTTVSAQNVGERYILHRPGKTIPGHPGPGNHAVSVRFPHGSIAEIKEIDQQTNWRRVEVGQATAWIIKKYLGQRYEEPATLPETTYRIGTWNLEWFKEGKTRGFPEYANGGPTIPPRTEEDYAAIAEIISHELNSAVMVLEEINGYDTPEGHSKSRELDRLIENLGSSYDYLISKSGNGQRVAILFDKNKVRLNGATEFVVPYEVKQGSDIFHRDPLVAHFTFLINGVDHSLNDFLIVGLHLASGQRKKNNHDRAMAILIEYLGSYLEEGAELHGEGDIVITGDLNLDIFDSKREQVLDQMEAGNYDILADEGYPATRLSGVPLQPRSKIDYIIVTDEMRGTGAEISASEAEVHQELAAGNYNDYRDVFSDHFPVTVKARVLPDDD